MVANATSTFNTWFIENQTDGVVGQFAKRSPETRPDDITHLTTYLKHLVKRWPADEAAKEVERVANGTPWLLGSIDPIESVFNTTLEQTLYAVWPNPFLSNDQRAGFATCRRIRGPSRNPHLTPYLSC